jgi:hypothetical protein
MKIEKLGLQMYTVRDHMTTVEGVRDALRSIKAMGYDQAQTAGCAISYEEYGRIATIIFMHIVIPIITAGFTYIIKIKDPVTHRNYLKEMEGKEYDKKADRQYILHSKMFRTECISYAIIFIFIALIGDPWFLLYALYSVLFVFYNLWMWMHLHKKWCNERFRK